MHPRDRHARIVETLDRDGTVTVEDLAERLDTSRETIRRDLAALDRRGLLRKTHGGARRMSHVPEEVRFETRMFSAVAEKRRIAAAAAGLLRNGDSLFLDAGSTSVFLAERLTGLAGLTVITNAVATLPHLAARGHRVFLLGGEFDGDARCTFGPQTEREMEGFRADHAILTVGAVTGDGVFDFDLREATVSRRMLAQARQVTVLADHVKFGRDALFRIGTLANIDRIVTDRAPDPALLRKLEAAGVSVIVAPP